MKNKISKELKCLFTNGLVKFVLVLIFCLNLTFTSLCQSDGNVELKKTVAILVYEGVYLMDFAGPLEVFYDTYSEDRKHLFNVYTVSPTKELKAHCGTRIIPDFEISSFPKPDILIVPGGKLNLLKEHPELHKWIVNIANDAGTVMSVCTGAFILADAGLLDSLNITTWHGALENLKKLVPTANVMSEVRYTDNGKIITTSGISAGIDGALYVVAKYFGNTIAKATAKYMEYEYNE